MKLFLSLPLVLLTVALLVACGRAAPEVASTDLLPAKANFIAQVQVERLLQDPDFGALLRQTSPGFGGPQSLDDVLEEVRQETGVDFRRFTSALLFADTTQDGEYFGVIARGQVDEEAFIAALTDSGEYTLSIDEYEGQWIYLDREDPANPAIAFLDDNIVLLGQLTAVRDVIDVQQGKQARASGRVYDTFKGLGDPLFGMAMVMPPEASRDIQESFGGGPGFGMMPALDAFSDLELISLVVDKPGNDLKVEATLDFLEARSAREIGDTLDGFLKLAAGFAPDPEMRALLGKLQLNVNGARLTINFQAPVSQLMEVGRGMEQDFGGQY